MKLLELFCGTKSVGKVANQLGYEVISLDICDKFNPTHSCDITDFDYKQYPVGYFDFIWASPPCTEFSLAKTTAPRQLDKACKVVSKAIEIINYLQPTHWAIENPVGLLKTMKIMEPLSEYMHTVSYCKYGFSYRKNTNIWTNKHFNPLICKKGSWCDARKDLGRHINTAQKGKKLYSHDFVQEATSSMSQRYAIPSDLVLDLLI